MGIGEILNISYEISKKYSAPGSEFYISMLLSQKSYIEDFKSKNIPSFNLQDFYNDVFGLLDEEDIPDSRVTPVYDSNRASCNDIINTYEKYIYENMIDKFSDIPYKDEERKKYIDQLLKSETMLLKLKNNRELNIENLLLKNNKTEVISSIPFSFNDSLKNLYVTLTLTIPLSQIKRFMLEFTKFCIKNNINSTCSSKIIVTNDMVKVKLTNLNDIDKVNDFISKYRVNYSENPFVNKYNGTGIIVGNIERYNFFVSEQIYNYIKNKKSIKKINEEEFRLYLQEYISKLDNSSIKYTNSINLSNILNQEEFDITKFKNEVEELDNKTMILK